MIEGASLRELTRVLNGTVAGGQVLCLVPGHSPWTSSGCA